MPNGGVYTGDAIDNGLGTIELSGLGGITYPDGSKYAGQWKYGRPYGYGAYAFPNRDFHKGFFDEVPNGVGYLCLNSTNSMKLGNYVDGKLNGWAMTLDFNRNFHFGWAEDNKIIKEYHDETEWMQDFLVETVFAQWDGKLIQIVTEKNQFIRYGAPRRKDHYGITHPPIGFTFYNDGTVIIGESADINNLNGPQVVCYPNQRIELGRWHNNECSFATSGNEVKATIQIRYNRRMFEQ